MDAEVPLSEGASPPDSPLYHRDGLDLRVVLYELVPGVFAHMMGYHVEIPRRRW